MAKKIKILFLAANPVDVNYRPELDKEYKAISQKIRGGEARDSFKLKSEWCVTPDNLQEILLIHKPHIVHFSGHANKELSLEDKSRNTFSLGRQAFTNLVKILKVNIRIVVLNACHTEEQAEELTDAVDFTIGMNDLLNDEAAIIFASHFYQGLAFRKSVRESFDLAISQLDISKLPNSKTPKLFTRRGANPNESILVKGRSKPPKPPSPGRGRRPEGPIREGTSIDADVRISDADIRGDVTGVRYDSRSK